MNYVYFSDEEVSGLKEPLPGQLDMMRGLMGIPVVLTFTTGGKHCGHSTHYLGEAVDIGFGHLAEGFIRDNYRYILASAAFRAGFKRIELCPLHAHVDIGQSPDYAAPVLILGQDA